MSELTLNGALCKNSMDIFLFSNGEQSSPPRKYHLELSEITMWKETLRHLGYSQYGLSDTYIDIYTTDGQKLDGPTQLQHLAVYVAVLPPSDFIQAGYDKYLIKATRSWEKRLIKITNSMDSATKDETLNALSQSGQIKKPENVSKKSISAKVKLDSVKTKNPCTKVAMNSNTQMKQTNKKLYQSESTTLKTQIFTPFKISNTKKAVINTKERFQRKPYIPRKFTPNANKRNDFSKIPSISNKNSNINDNVLSAIKGVNVQERKSENTISQNNKLTTSSLKGIQNIERTPSTVNEEQISSTFNQTVENKNLRKSTEKVMTLTKNGDDNGDIGAVVTFNQSDHKSSTGAFENNGSKTLVINTVNQINTGRIKSNLNLTEEIKVLEQKQSETVCQDVPIHRSLDNFIAIVNNDKILKLQLNLEIQNCNVTINTDHTNVTRRQSFKNINNADKETQVTLYENSVDNKQIHTNFHKRCVLKNSVDDKEKVFVLKCCCNNDACEFFCSNDICNPDCFKETETKSGIDDDAISCECYHPTFTETKNDMIDDNIKAPRPEANESELVDATSEEKQLMYLNQDNNRFPLTDKATQTNWCSLLLKATRDQNGRYSFHLPPLRMIKNIPLNDF